jgi:peptidoglycan/xylan/chitin deacetylase (PgdA/CDA1 family)
VLAYHSVSDEWVDPLCVSRDVFAGQLRALARRGYRGVRFSDVARGVPREQGRAVAITFDDAFATVLSARAVLDELGWVATVFPVTSSVETHAPMRRLIGDRWRPEVDRHIVPLTWNELGELVDAGWEVGSHTRTHPLLSSLDDEAALEELRGSRAEVEERFGQCSAISYPWGELDDRVIRLARSSGYSSGSGLVGGRRGEPLAVPRFAVAADDGPLGYALKTFAPVWKARSMKGWRGVDRLRHGRDRHRGSGTHTFTVAVLDGDTGPGLAVVRSLGRAGWRVLVPAGSRAERSRYSSGTAEIPNAAAAPPAFADALRELGSAGDVDVVVPTTDASLAAAWDVLGSTGQPHILGGDRETVRIALDKVKSLRAAEEYGFPVPAWRAPDSHEAAHAALDEIGVPCVVKPRRSFVVRGDSLAHLRHSFVLTHDELEPALAALSGESGPPILQEYVPGRALSVSAVIHDGEILASIARETFTFYPVAGGTSVWKRTIDPDDAGVVAALDLLRSVRLDGVAEVEYQVGPDRIPRLMEIGARLHGWVPLAIAAGVDLPQLAASAAVGIPVAPVKSYRVGAEMRWPAGELLRLRDALTRPSVLPPGVPRSRVVASAWPPWRPGMRYDGIELRDLGPLLRSPLAQLRRVEQ